LWKLAELGPDSDKKLYRSEHDTFEAYCREKWQYAKSHVYRLIGAQKYLRVCPNWGHSGAEP